MEKWCTAPKYNFVPFTISLALSKHMTRTTRTAVQGYTKSLTFRIVLLVLAALLLPAALCFAVSVGAASIPFRDTIFILCGGDADPRLVRTVLSIRLPQALTALVAGAGLAIAGATMQGVLRNPLCSPFTLGISHAAAFGAALTLVFGGGSAAMLGDTLARLGLPAGLARSGTALGAFVFAMLATVAILLLSRFRGTRSETIILIGVALGSLFSAGLMFLQYMVDDSRLAAIVYWTFGDTARANWTDVTMMTLVVAPISIFFVMQSWNYNALIFGEETALGLGVPARRLRIGTMLLSSIITAVLVSLLGIIGFVGLVVPHFARLLIGSDYRFLLPFSLLCGALLLLLADTAARFMMAPRILPVSVLTAFIGAPVFLSLLLRKRGVSC